MFLQRRMILVSIRVCLKELENYSVSKIGDTRQSHTNDSETNIGITLLLEVV